jgi:putative ABC transport system substrate-binding protein
VQQLQPGGNATGFMSFEYSMAGKWLGLLKQIAPGVNRVAVLRDAVSPSGNALFGVIQAMAPSVRVEVTPVNMRDAGEIERSLAAFARTRSDGLIVTASGPAYNYRDLIVALAARHKLPAVYYEHVFAASGGLVSYGSDLSTSTVKRPAMSIASSRARSRPICRCRRRPSLNW